jgi:hypothetical protein
VSGKDIYPTSLNHGQMLAQLGTMTLDVFTQDPGADASARGLGWLQPSRRPPPLAGTIALNPRQLWRAEPSRCACMRPSATGTSKLRSISSLWGTWCFRRTLLVVRQVLGRPGADSLRVWPHRKCHGGQEQYGNCADNRDDWAGNLGPLTNRSAAPPHLLGLSKQVLGIATAAPAVGSKQ